MATMRFLLAYLLLATASRPQDWADENVCDCVGAVSKHHHSPSGRVGLSGPERAIRFAKYHRIHRKTAPPGRYRIRPPHGEVNGRSANIFIRPVRGPVSLIGFLPFFHFFGVTVSQRSLVSNSETAVATMASTCFADERVVPMI